MRGLGRIVPGWPHIWAGSEGRIEGWTSRWRTGPAQGISVVDSHVGGGLCGRGQAWGCLLAVLIVLLAWPRLTGPSWWVLRMPFDLRESEGNAVQWEHYLFSNVLRATLQSECGASGRRTL